MYIYIPFIVCEQQETLAQKDKSSAPKEVLITS